MYTSRLRMRLFTSVSKQTLASLLWAIPVLAASSAGSIVEVRLLTPVSTYRTKPGTEVRGLLATPVCLGAGNTLAEGTILTGSVKHVHKIGFGIIHETARIEFAFEDLRLPDGSSYPVEARLVGVDNARERVDRGGAIHGIRATATVSNRLGERLVFAAAGHPAAMIPLFAVETSLFRFPEPEIEFGPGTELEVQMELPEALGRVATCESSPQEGGSSELHALVDGIPIWSFSKRQPQPMDLVNLIFVGTERELDAAFTAAGWGGARANSMGAGLKAVRAIVEQREYDDAPMRTLVLDGAEQSLSLQKSLNTFEKRHHLRIWRRAEDFHGRTVWASAATRDIGATFSIRPFGFTHEIQNDVDWERDKVVRDLEFTGCVDSVRLVARAPQPAAGPKETRKSLRTDGRVAVVMLNACESPRLDLAESDALAPPPTVVRYIRRVMLTTRNHFVRDNIFYRSGDAARIGFLALRRKVEEHRSVGIPKSGDGTLTITAQNRAPS